MKKILLATPISKYKDYCIWEWLRHIKKLTYPVDILLVDNSEDVSYHQQIAATGIKCIRHFIPGQELRLTMAQCNEKIREYAKRRNYDYIFSLECDVFPPFNVIERLLNRCNQLKALNESMVNRLILSETSIAQVQNGYYTVGAPYFIAHGAYSKPMLQNSMPVSEENGQKQLEIINFTVKEAFWKFNGELQRVHSQGLGCVLIPKAVFQVVPFRIDPEIEKAHADSFFFKDLGELFIPSFSDTSLMCRHWNGHWNFVNQNEEVKSFISQS